MLPSVVPPLLIFLTQFFLFNSKIASSVHLDTSGYEQCVLNLVDSDIETTRRNCDLMEEILGSNQKYQVWTVFTSVALLNAAQSTIVSLNEPIYLNEQCSINFVVATEEGFRPDLLFVFGSRLYDAMNSFLFFLPHNVPPFMYKYAVRESGPAPADTYILQLSLDNRTVTTLNYFCSIWWEMYDFKQHQSHSLSINRMKQFSARSRAASFKPTIAAVSFDSEYDFEDSRCKFLYRTRRLTNTMRIGCQVDHLFIENAADKFNLSVAYIPMELAEYYGWFLYATPGAFHGFALLRVLTWTRWHYSTDKLMSQVLQYSTDYRFIYCREVEERESFNAIMWMAPFGAWAWALLGVTVVALALLVRRQWVNIVGVLFRQAYKIIRGRVAVILFVLICIVLTCIYESIISSILIAPPPVIVFKSLKALVRSGYNISGFRDGTPELEEILEQENISATLSSGRATQQGYVDDSDLELLSNCNLAMLVSNAYIKDYLLRMSINYPSISCYHVKQTAFKGIDVYNFHGESRLELAATAQIMRQSGITQMIDNYTIFINNYHTNVEMENAEFADSQKAVAFSITDWKILSIFTGWGLLIGICISAFLTELVFNYRYRVRGWVKYSFTEMFYLLFAMARFRKSKRRVKRRAKRMRRSTAPTWLHCCAPKSTDHTANVMGESGFAPGANPGTFGIRRRSSGSSKPIQSEPSGKSQLQGDP